MQVEQPRPLGRVHRDLGALLDVPGVLPVRVHALLEQGAAPVGEVGQFRHQFVDGPHEPGLRDELPLVRRQGRREPRQVGGVFVHDPVQRLALPGLLGRLRLVGQPAEGVGVPGVHLGQVVHEGVLGDEAFVEVGGVVGGQRGRDEAQHDGVVGVGLGRGAVGVVGDPVDPAEREGEVAERDDFVGGDGLGHRGLRQVGLPWSFAGGAALTSVSGSGPTYRRQPHGRHSV